MTGAPRSLGPELLALWLRDNAQRVGALAAKVQNAFLRMADKSTPYAKTMERMAQIHRDAANVYGAALADVTLELEAARGNATAQDTLADAVDAIVAAKHAAGAIADDDSPIQWTAGDVVAIVERIRDGDWSAAVIRQGRFPAVQLAGFSTKRDAWAACQMALAALPADREPSR